MKQWITLIASVAILASCSKSSLQDEQSASAANSTQITTDRAVSSGVYMSGWETFSNWSKKDSSEFSIFYKEVSVANFSNTLAAGGTVLTFAKIVNAAPRYEVYKTPQLLDFYFVPTAGRSKEGYYKMYDYVNGSQLTIGYTLPQTTSNFPGLDDYLNLNNFVYQYFVLPADFLNTRGMNAQSIQSVTYDQLIDMVTPK